MTSTYGTRAKLLGTLASVLTALAVVVGSVGLAAPAEAATTTVTLTGASTAWSDQTTTLTATWKIGTKGHRGTVTLQRKSGSTWTKVAAKTTTTTGVAKFAVKPTTTTTYRALTSTKKASKSRAITVKPAYTLTSNAGSTIMAGTSKKFAVTYRHHGVGVTGTVALERHSGSSWVKATSVRITSGHGGVTVHPTVTTAYRFHVVGKVASASHTVTVKPPSTFSIVGSGSGHGVGLSQYGAYEMALEGYSASQVLGYYYPGTSTATPVNNPGTRIAVHVYGPGSDTATTTVTVTTGEYQIGGAAGHLTPVTVPTGTPLLLSTSGSTVVAKFGTTTLKGSKLSVQWPGTTFLASSMKAVAKISATGRSYRNGELVATSIDGRLNIVNDVLLHTEYLYGIDEMPSIWGTASRSAGTGAAALQAQAVAARGYALTKVLADRIKYASPDYHDPACGCDVYDDTRSQNYTGWAKEGGADGSTWKSAVDATVQKTDGTVTIVRDGNGAFAQTVYSAAPGYPTSTTGGTANNQDAFGTARVPYLQHVTDPYTKKYMTLNASAASTKSIKQWTDSVSQTTAQKVFGLSSVRSIAVTSRYSSGQARTLTATADNGTGKTATVSASPEWWRTTLGLPAAWVTSFTPKP